MDTTEFENHEQEEEFNQVYDQYAAAILRYTYLKVSDYELAQDLTAETFVRFWQALKKQETIRYAKTFLYLIAHGLVVDYYRQRKKNAVAMDQIDERLLSNLDEVESRLETKSQMNQVYSMLATIHDEYREVLLLRYVEDLETEEIAAILNKKEATVRVLIHRALAALKAKL